MRVKRQYPWHTLLAITLLFIPLLFAGCKTTNEEKKWAGLSDNEKSEQPDGITIARMVHARTQKGDKISLASNKPLTYQVFRLNNPNRVVLIFPKTTLGPTIQPTVIRESKLTGLFPSEEKSGGSRIEVTLKKPLEYEVIERDDGLDITFLSENKLLLNAKAVVDNLAVNHLQNSTELRLLGSGKVDTVPKVYRLNNPPRLVIDMVGVDGPPHGRRFVVNSPYVLNALLMGGPQKTRLVVELVDAIVGYKVENEAGMPVIHLGQQLGGGNYSEKEKQAIQNGVHNIQFTRDGQGALVRVLLNNRGGQLRTRREGDKLFLSLANTPVAKQLLRRMDVRSYGGPVLYIDTESREESTFVVVTMNKAASRHEVLEKGGEILVRIHPAPVDNDENDSPFTGSKISLDFKDIDVQNALRIIAEVSDLNIILSDTVSGTITMRLVDVPWDHALELILEAKGLGRVKQGNVLRVAPLAEIKSTTQARLQAKQSVQQLEPFVTEMIPVSFATGEEIKTLLMEGDQKRGTRLVSSAGTVSIDKRTNTLIIKDTAENIPKIRAMVKKLDKPIAQVLIEARIVEVDRNSKDEFGINWGFATKSTEGGFGVSDNAANAYEAHMATAGTSNPRARLTTATPSNINLMPASSNARIGAHVGGISPLVDLDIEIAALEEDNKAKTISSPRVLTTNNKIASISQGIKVPYTIVEDGVKTTTFVEAKLSLEVTPHVTPDSYITMQINATNDSIASLGPPPSVNTKTINTQALVYDGETIVLGGIFQNNQVRNKASVPGLSNIPFLGWMFENYTDADTQSELLIFITPHIIHPN
ncbi:MAG: type IV pilus secretin PilQ [Magnetococcales bacterium]|nr:type IV pilus secretin PilQ [Magnetococcales bacterium]